MRACRFSSVRSGCETVELRAQRALVGLHRPTRSAARARARRARRRACARRPACREEEKREGMIATLTRSAPSASTARQATSAESIPPESPSTTCCEAVLLDVVVQPEHQRRVDLGLDRREQARDAAAPGGRSLAGGFGARGQRRQDRDARALPARERRARRARCPASRSRAAAAASRSTSQISSSSRNCAARAIVVPVWSTTHECPSKTSSSWPPTSAQKATQARLSRARCANIRSRSRPLPA